MKRFSIAVSSLAIALCGVSQAAAEPMDGPTIEATLPGMSVIGIYEDGLWFSEIYAPDGTISYVDAESGHFVGGWAVRGNLFCTEYDGVEGLCMTVEQTSSNCFLFAPAPAPAIKGAPPAEMVDGNVIGWNAIEPSTCETTAAAEPATPRTK